MDIVTVVAVVEALVLGTIGVLKLVAPKTKTLADDAVLARLVSIEEVLAKLVTKYIDPLNRTSPVLG